MEKAAAAGKPGAAAAPVAEAMFPLSEKTRVEVHKSRFSGKYVKIVRIGAAYDRWVNLSTDVWTSLVSKRDTIAAIINTLTGDDSEQSCSLLHFTSINISRYLGLVYVGLSQQKSDSKTIINLTLAEWLNLVQQMPDITVSMCNFDQPENDNAVMLVQHYKWVITDAANREHSRSPFWSFLKDKTLENGRLIASSIQADTQMVVNLISENYVLPDPDVFFKQNYACLLEAEIYKLAAAECVACKAGSPGVLLHMYPGGCADDPSNLLDVYLKKALEVIPQDVGVQALQKAYGYFQLTVPASVQRGLPVVSEGDIHPYMLLVGDAVKELHTEIL